MITLGKANAVEWIRCGLVWVAQLLVVYGCAPIIIDKRFALPFYRRGDGCNQATVKVTRISQWNDGFTVVGALPRPAVGTGDKLNVHGLVACVMAV